MRKFKLIKEYPGSPKLGKIEKVPRFPRADNDELYFHITKYPEFWEEVVEKDYEILKFILPGGNILHIQNAKNPLEFMLNNSNTYKIYSIKRLSDGEVFSIGDKLETGIIKQFYLPDNIQKEITIYVTKDDEDTYLSEAVKFKKPLFTTEDDVDIFEGDNVHFVCEEYDYHYVKNVNDTHCGLINCGKKGVYKIFPTKEKAEEYILMNKPCLSINDIFKDFEEMRKGLKTFENSQLAKRFKKLVQQKLNK
jgi:hypothetical protein